MAFLHPADDLHVLVRLHAIAHGPEHRGLIRRVDVLVDGDNDFPDAGVERRRGVERTPHLGLLGALHLHDDELVGIGQGLVHLHPDDAGDAAVVPQVHQHEPVVADLADDRRLAWGDLAEPGDVDGVFPVRDRRDVHERVQLPRMHVPVGLAERPLGLHELGVEVPFDDDLGLGRHLQVHGLALGHADGLAHEAAGDGHLVHAVVELLDGDVGDHRRGADDQGRGKRLTALLGVLPVKIDVLAEPGREHPDAGGGLDLAAVVADVGDAGLGVLGDPVGTGGVGAVVPARGRDGDRKRVQAFLFQGFAGDALFLAHRVVHQHGGDGIGESVLPFLVHLLGAVAAHAEKVDGLAAGQGAHHHRELEAAPAGVRDVGEVPSLAVLVGNAAAVLPPHQRMQLGVLVDGLIDAA